MKNILITRAKRQIEKTINSEEGIFSKDKNVFIRDQTEFLKIITFGSNLVFVGSEEMITWCKERFANQRPETVLEDSNREMLNLKLSEYNKKLSSVSTRYLQLKTNIMYKPIGYVFKFYKNEEILLIKDAKINKLYQKNQSTYVLLAYKESHLVGYAKADLDVGELWSLSVDVNQTYKTQGVGRYLVAKLTEIVRKEGRLPYYLTNAFNLGSTRLALSCGYLPVWVACSAIEFE